MRLPSMMVLTLVLLPSCAQSGKRPDISVRPAPAAVASVASAAATPSPAPREDKLDPRSRGWKLGQRYSYRLSMSSQVAIGSGAVADFDLTGSLEVVPVRVAAEAVTLFMSVKGGRFASRLSAAQADLDQRATKLGSTYFATFQGGRVSATHLAENADAVVANVYRTLSAALQLALPAESAQHWTAFEFDSTGKYAARYEKTSDPSVIRKRKTHYLGVLSADSEGDTEPLDLSPTVVASDGELRLAEDGRLLELRSEDALEVDSAQAPIQAKTRVVLQGGTVAKAYDTAALAARLTDTERLPAHASHGAAPDRHALDDARIGGLSFDAIMGRLEEIAGKAAGRALSQEEQQTADREDARLFTALAATLRREPTLIAKVVTKAEGDSPAVQVVLDALASAGTAPAQAALVELLSAKSKLPAHVKNYALLSLSRTANPSAASVRTLMAIAADKDGAAQALYGLGTFVRLLREQHQPELAKQAAQVLVKRLAAAKTRSELSDCLKALANSGYSPALRDVKRLLADPREQVRIDALTAMRLMESDEIDPLLANALERDPVEGVRTRAMEVALRREPSDVMVKSLQGAIAAESAHVRYGAVRLMSEWLPQRPELRAALEHVAKSDSEQKVRALAQAGL